MSDTKKTTVCFIALQAYPLLNTGYHGPVGGGEVQLVQLAKIFSEQKNNHISFIVRDHCQPAEEVISGIDVYAFNDNPKLFSRIKGIRVIPIVFRFFFLLKKINAQFYIQRSAGFLTFLIALFCRLFQKKFIYMVAHDWDCTKEFEQSNGAVGKLFVLGLRWANVVVSQHQEQRALLLENYGVQSIVVKSAYPINPLAAGQPKDFILWVGRCDTWKHPEVFLLLVQRFPHQKFVMVIAQAGDETLFRHILNEGSVYQNLTVKTNVPFKDVDTYFQQAKVFVNTSAYEGFPNTFIQAAKNNTPIVSLHVNPENFLTVYECGYFAENSLEHAARFLEKLLKDELLWQRMSNNALVYAQKNHSIQDVSKKIQALFV